MKFSFYKFVMFALIGLLAFAPALTVSAQDCPPGISADDCKLMTDAMGMNASKLSSFAMDFTVNASVKGVEGGDITLQVSGSGGIDTSKVDMTAEDPMTALAGLIFSIMMDAKASGGGMDQAGSVEIRIVDGNAYGKGFDGTDTWQKVSAEELFSQLGAMSGDMSGGMGDIGGLLGNLDNPALAGLLGAVVTTYSATDGPNIDGSTRAITASTDLKPLLTALADPQIAEALSQVIPQDDPNVAQIGSLLPLLGALFSEAKIDSTTYYGTDGTFRGFKLSASLVVDGQMAAMLTGSPTNIDVKLELDVRLTKLGEPFTVEAPIE